MSKHGGGDERYAINPCRHRYDTSTLSCPPPPVPLSPLPLGPCPPLSVSPIPLSPFLPLSPSPPVPLSPGFTPLNMRCKLKDRIIALHTMKITNYV